MSETLERWRDRFGDRHPYYPQLARVAGGAAAALLLDYLLARSEEAGVSLEPGAIAATLGLNAQELAAARRQLRDRDLLAESLAADGRSAVGRLDPAALEQRLAAFEQWLGSPAPPEAAAPASAARDRFFPAPRPQPTVGVTPHYRFAGPWRSPEELEAFQRALIDYFKHQGARQPADKAAWTIDGISKGLVSPYWEEFAAGQPLGSSQQVQRDWELAPGVPYPAFVEDRTQYYCQRGEPLEAAVERARRDLRDPQRGQDLWDGFLRKCDRLAEEARQAQQLGVRTPYLPPAFSEVVQPSKQSAIAKLAALASEPAPPASLPLAAAKPSLAALQTLYQSPLGRRLVIQQLAEHPEWGYRLEAGQVIAECETDGKTRPD